MSNNFTNTILLFSYIYILSKPKTVLFQSTTVFRGAPHGCANSKTSEERVHEQRTTHGRLELWRIYMTTLHYTKTIDVGRKSFSHLMWVHQWISFTRISGFSSLFIWPSNNINNCDIFYVKTKFLLYISWRRIRRALTFLVKSTGYLSKSTSPMISGWVRRGTPHFIR